MPVRPAIDGPIEATCIFCDIVAGRAPASVVHDDDTSVAFLDIRPVTPGHLLVIPKRHATYLADLDEPTGGHLVQVAMRLAAALRRTNLRADGINLFLADGVAAGLEVFHVHLHVFLRYPGDRVHLSADWSSHPHRKELDAIAVRVREANLSA